jgi:hypothetical protein
VIDATLNDSVAWLESQVPQGWLIATAIAAVDDLALGHLMETNY